MELLGIVALLLALLLGLLALFTRPSAADRPGTVGKQQKAKKKKTGKKHKGTKAGSELPPAGPVCAPEHEAEDEQQDEEASESEEDANFLGLDDVLPNTRGAYAVEGFCEDANDSTLDDWEAVDTAKYNIPKGNRVNSQGLQVQQAKAQTPARAAGAGNCGKSRNDRRREKEQLLRQSILSSHAGGANVANRMGTSLKRPQKEAGSHKVVPGM